MSIARKFPILLTVLLMALTGCQTDPVAVREQFLESARDYAQRDELEEALIQYRNAVQVDPGYVPTRMELADTLKRLGQHQFAVQEYRAVLEIAPDSAQARVELANYSMQAGLLEQAQQQVDELLAADPDSTDALLVQGNLQTLRQEWEAARQSFMRIMEIDPDNLGARLNLAQLERTRGNLPAARELLEKAVEKHPESDAAHRAFGVTLAAAGDVSQAEEQLREALAADPDNLENIRTLIALLRRDGRPEEVEPMLREAASAAPDAVVVQLALVDHLRNTGSRDEALQKLEELSAAHDSNPQVLLRLAEAYVRQDRREDVDRILNRLRELRYAPAVVSLLEGQVAQAQGRLQDALKSYDDAIASNPDLLQAYLFKANARLQQATPEAVNDAERTLREALSVDSSSTAARGLLAKALATRDSSAGDALFEAGQVLAQDPGNHTALEARAEALLRTRQLDAARQDFETLSAANPDNAYYLHRLGTVAGLQARLEESGRYFEEALRLQPDYTVALTDLMVVFTKKGDFDGALAALDRLSADATKQDVFHVYRARILLYKQDAAAARKELEQAIAINENNFAAYQLLGQLAMAEGKVDEAITEVDQILERSPSNSGAYFLRGLYNQQGGRNEAAIDDYRRAVQIAPDNHIASNNLAWMLAERNQNLAEARELAQRARREQPENVEYADTLGWVLYKLGNYTLALDQFLFVTNNGPGRAEHYYHLGMAYYSRNQEGDAGLAKQVLEKALSIQAEFAGAAEARRILRELGAE